MKKLFNQAIRFFGLSGIGWILDFCTYTGLGFLSSNVVVNNMISSWVGVTFVFIFATRRVFQNHSNIPLKAKYVIYLLYQLVLIFCVSRLLGIVDLFLVQHVQMDFVLRFSSILAKIIITPVTMVLNFIVMKGVIEKL